MAKARRRYWPKGHGYAWLVSHKNHQGDDCLRWPFAQVRGYGAFFHDLKRRVAHRFMCELVNGPPPTPKHQAAHTCGKGHEGCVNPRHLVWKTASENSLDRRLHGTSALNRDGPRGRLSDDQWDEIRALRSMETQEATAKRYGISMRHVRDIQKSVQNPDRSRFLTPAQVNEIRASHGRVKGTVLAKKFNVSTNTISLVARGLAYRDTPSPRTEQT